MIFIFSFILYVLAILNMCGFHVKFNMCGFNQQKIEGWDTWARYTAELKMSSFIHKAWHFSKKLNMLNNLAHWVIWHCFIRKIKRLVVQFYCLLRLPEYRKENVYLKTSLFRYFSDFTAFMLRGASSQVHTSLMPLSPLLRWYCQTVLSFVRLNGAVLSLMRPID